MRGPVASQPSTESEARTGTSHQYRRTRERADFLTRFGVFFGYTGTGMGIAFATILILREHGGNARTEQGSGGERHSHPGRGGGRSLRARHGGGAAKKE